MADWEFMKKTVSLVCFVVAAFFGTHACAAERVLLVVGDSLSAGYNMRLDQAWPSLLQNRLQGNGHSYRVVNASITGDTTQGGLARLPRLLQRHEPDMVIIELGGNDGLRGLSLEVTRRNLSGMIEASQAMGAGVILAGIMLPPNYGVAYTDRFQSMYPELSDTYGLPLIPFLLEGVALNPELMMADGIHPTAGAQPILLENVWSVLVPELD
jgi:acyl-CoA thioesterase-1